MREQNFFNQSTDGTRVSTKDRSGRLSLRGQGLLLVLLGAVLVIAHGLFMLSQRERLRETFTSLAAMQQLESRFNRLSEMLGRADHELDSAAAMPDPSAGLPLLETELASILNEVQDLSARFPEIALKDRTLFHLTSAWRHDMSAKTLRDIGSQLHNVGFELNRIIQTVSSDRRKLSDRWYRVNMSVNATSAIASMIALVGFGAFMLFFFRCLATDVTKLSKLAREIALGNPYKPLRVTRCDEVGELTDAMNQMAAQLLEREKQLVIARQQYFHSEKMVAIGSLAAGVAHEVGNPLEIISGVAQAIFDSKDHSCQSCGRHCQPELILEQVRRVSNITRELSNFTGPSQPDLKLEALNELVRNTCVLMRYDLRYRQIELIANLDSKIPALRIVGDQFVQVLMNLLINAADAFGPAPKSAARVSISTRLVESSIQVQVEDNASGMDPVILNKAFDPFFTTKPFGQGSGLGLTVCKSMIEAYGGTLALRSTVDRGTTVTILFPPDTRSQAGAVASPARGATVDVAAIGMPYG